MKKFQTISVPKVTRIEALPISSRFCIKAMKSLEDMKKISRNLHANAVGALVTEETKLAEQAASRVEEFLKAIVEGLESEEGEENEGKN